MLLFGHSFSLRRRFSDSFLIVRNLWCLSPILLVARTPLLSAKCCCVVLYLPGAKVDVSDTDDVFNIAVCELSGHLPTYSEL